MRCSGYRRSGLLARSLQLVPCGGAAMRVFIDCACGGETSCVACAGAGVLEVCPYCGAERMDDGLPPDLSLRAKFTCDCETTFGEVEAFTEVPDYEEVCTCCDGVGEVSWWGMQPKPCVECAGRGVVRRVRYSYEPVASV